MGEPIDSGGDGPRSVPPPELPKRLLELLPIVLGGTALWFAAFFVLLVAGEHGTWMWTTLAGSVLGLIGLPIMAWQRAAARNGSKGAQDGL